MDERACGEGADANRREVELFADLDREQGHAARVLLGVGVLLGEPDGERPHVRAEVRLFGRDEVCTAEISRERPRLSPAAKVECDRNPDDDDAEQLEAVSEPPAELPVVEQHGGWDGGGQPDDADHDDQIGAPAGQEEGAQGAQSEEGVEGEPDSEQRQCGSASRLRNAGHEARDQHSGHAHREDHR